MTVSNMGQADATLELLQRAAAGDHESWEKLLTLHAERLRAMVTVRLDPRLYRRLDAEDVLQEAFIEAATRLPEYLQSPRMPFFLWLRFLVGQKLIQLQRHHLGARKRDARCEIVLIHGSMPAASSVALAARLLGRDTRASEVALRAERQHRLQSALNTMDQIDREVLVLRHFEQLSNAECAQVLGLTQSAATKRYLRALKRLKEILIALPDGSTGFWT
jgi:RNA polymerase sigma-70 factor, ECF subfamily